MPDPITVALEIADEEGPPYARMLAAEVRRLRVLSARVLELVDRLDDRWGGRTMHDDVVALRAAVAKSEKKVDAT